MGKVYVIYTMIIMAMIIRRTFFLKRNKNLRELVGKLEKFDPNKIEIAQNATKQPSISPYTKAKPSVPWHLMWQTKGTPLYKIEIFTMSFGVIVSIWAIYAFYHCFTVWGIGAMGSHTKKT